MPAKTTLDVNESTTMKVIARFQNETDITRNVNGQTETIEVKINAEQDDGNGGMDITPAKFTGTIYRWNTKPLYNVLTMNGPAELYYNPSNYSSAQEAFEADPWNVYKEKQSCGETCQSGTVTLSAGEYTIDASALNKNYYLKHDVDEDIITASYVCFVYNNAEYCMKGGDGASFAANTQMIKDFQNFNHLPDDANPGCAFNSSNSGCHGGGFDHIYAGAGGIVYVTGSSSEGCYSDYAGISNCRG